MVRSRYPFPQNLRHEGKLSAKRSAPIYERFGLLARARASWSKGVALRTPCPSFLERSGHRSNAWLSGAAP